MSRNKKWSLGLILATVMVLLGGVLSSAQADSHTPGGDGYTAPAPTKSDASGTANDQYYIPMTYFTHPEQDLGGYYVNGQSKTAGWHSTQSAASITITTDWDSGSWTFDYTSTNMGVEAPNQYWATKGACDNDVFSSSYGRWEVTFFVKNVDDDTNLKIDELQVDPNRVVAPIAIGPTMAWDIQDGETRPIELNAYVGGLPPGTWNLDVFRDGNLSTRVGRVRIFLPACGDNQPPPGDPGVNPPPVTVIKPKASVVLIRCYMGRMKVVLNNRASTKAVRFAVVRDPRRGRTTVRYYTVGANKVPPALYRKVDRRGVIKVKSGGKVLAYKVRPRRC